MHISDVYRPRLLTCQADDRLRTVAQKMAAEQVSALALVDDARIAGIISERDVTRAVADGADPGLVTAALYASTQLKTATLDDDTHSIAQLMLDADVRHLPVVDDRQLIGMVSMRDLLAVEAWA